MSVDRSPQAVLDEIATLARGDDLARLVHTVAVAAADERRSRIEDGLYLGGHVSEPPRGATAVLNLCEVEDPYRAAAHRSRLS